MKSLGAKWSPEEVKTGRAGQDIEAEVKSLGAKWSPEEVETGRAGQESGECVMPPMQTSARCSLLS